MMPSGTSASMSFRLPESMKSFMSVLSFRPRLAPPRRPGRRVGRWLTSSADTGLVSSPTPSTLHRHRVARRQIGPMPDGRACRNDIAWQQRHTDEMNATSSGIVKISSRVVEPAGASPLTKPSTAKSAGARSRARRRCTGQPARTCRSPSARVYCTSLPLELARGDVVHTRDAEDVVVRVCLGDSLGARRR